MATGCPRSDRRPRHVRPPVPLTEHSAACSLARAEDPKAIGLCGIAINDLDWRPSPLPNADAWRAREADLPAGAFDRNARPGLGNARPVRTVQTQHVGEDRDRVVALEGDEGRRLAQPLEQSRLDPYTEWTEAVGQVAQERDSGAVVAQQPQP